MSATRSATNSTGRPVRAVYPSTEMRRTVMALLCAAATAAANMKAFPPADDGMVRHVLQLPPQADGDALKVELVLGETIKTDSANRYFFGGKIAVEAIQGWGFDRYVLKQVTRRALLEKSADSLENWFLSGVLARDARGIPARSLQDQI